MHLDALLKDLGPETAIVMEFNGDGTTKWNESTVVCRADDAEQPYEIPTTQLDHRLAS